MLSFWLDDHSLCSIAIETFCLKMPRRLDAAPSDSPRGFPPVDEDRDFGVWPHRGYGMTETLTAPERLSPAISKARSMSSSGTSWVSRPL